MQQESKPVKPATKPTVSNFYRLRIVRPLDAEIDPTVRAKISESAEPQDETLDAKIARWISDLLSEAESKLSDGLPEGWYAKIETRP